MGKKVDMKNLAGETIVVTGGSQGIGLAIAKNVAAKGAHVLITDIQDGSDAVKEIEDAGGSAEFRKGDVTSEESMRAVFKDIKIDGLVNNAAYFAPLMIPGNLKPFTEITVEEFEKVMSVNTTGVFIATKEAVPSFNEGARIVNISSGTIMKGTPGFFHYIASKAAVVGMTRSMAKELADKKIRVNAIMPGLTASPASLQAGEDRIQQRAEASQIIKRAIQPEDVANVIGFLLSHESGMMTGQVVNVDGGNVFY